MKLRDAVVFCILTVGSTLAWESSPAEQTRLRMGHTATRAIANFRSADSIEERLRAQGLSLNSRLVALRLRIEATLDEAQAAIDKGDLKKANKSLDRADGFLDQYARKLGGD